MPTYKVVAVPVARSLPWGILISDDKGGEYLTQQMYPTEAEAQAEADRLIGQSSAQQ
jgi:hypothetical protein